MRHGIQGILAGALAVTFLTAASYSKAADMFSKISSGPLAESGAWLGAAAADYDNDGDTDILVTDYGGKNGLFKNDGEGNFTRETESLIVSDRGWSTGALWSDFDNDGWLDLFIANANDRQNQLYFQDTFGEFEETTSGAPFTNAFWSFSPSAADIDNDGYLDLYVSELDHKDGLFRNNGDRTFSLIDSAPINASATASNSGSWADIDNDGDLDLFVAVRGQKSQLYRNNGNWMFSSVPGPWEAVSAYSTGGCWGDYDNDGWMDLYVANRGTSNNLYRNKRDGTFERITTGLPVEDLGNSNGCLWADLDNDGWLDLVVANWVPDSPASPNNAVYLNNGNGTFSRLTVGDIANDGGDTVGTTTADFNGDGYLDVLFVNYSGEGNSFHMNNGGENHWLRINLTGEISNRQGIGARIKIQYQDGQSIWREQSRDVTAGHSFSSQQELTAHFGVAESTLISNMSIRWPSGMTSQVFNVVPNQTLQFSESAESQLQISPLGGNFLEPIFVSILSPVIDGDVYYSLDGTEPDSSSTRYNVPFVLNQSTTVKATHYLDGIATTAVVSTHYNIFTEPELRFAPGSGDFFNSIEVTLVNDLSVGSLRFTLDGSNLNPTSEEFVSPITLNESTEIRAGVFFNSFPISEIYYSTYRRVYSTLDDGITFAWREGHFGSEFLTNPDAATDADPDMDGFTNFEEFRSDTDPTDSESKPILISIRAIPKLTFEVTPGRNYRILRKGNVNAAEWGVVETSLMAGTNSIATFVDEDSGPRAFYKVELITD